MEGDVEEVTIAHGRHDIGRGVPEDIWRHGAPLTDRQQKLLDKLPEYDSRVTVPKSEVSMMDLAALTAKTNVEFAMFTKNGERLVLRGDMGHVNIDVKAAEELNRQGYKWSGHTHIGSNRVPSANDKTILACFTQKNSVVYNALGKRTVFGI